MITILIGGPQGVGKTKIAQMIAKILSTSGFVSVRLYTTNEEITIPKNANREDYE